MNAIRPIATPIRCRFKAQPRPEHPTNSKLIPGQRDPRFGFAYDPFRDHKTSIRGGFGIFHDVIQARVYTSGYYYNPPYTLASGIPFPAFPNPFVSGLPTGSISQATGIDYNGVTTPYQMQWNINVQREIMNATVLTVGYVASRGLHLFEEIDLNPVLPETVNGVQVYGVPRGAAAVGIAPDLRTNPLFGALNSGGSSGGRTITRFRSA